MARFDSGRPKFEQALGFLQGAQAARGSLLCRDLGGLNYQIEHHLFPKISHIHYPRLAPIVEAACAEFGVRYTAHAGLLPAISSHWRWLRKMGKRSV